MSEPDQDHVVPVSAPMAGTVIDLSDVPDPVFSSKAVGDGLGIEPADDGAIVSPVDATVTMVAGTGHAIGFQGESGLEVLLHLGVDTVELEGAPFDLSVKVGDTVKAGQSLGTMDLEAVRAAGKATTAIVVLTNTITHLADLNVTTGRTDAGAVVATASLKVEGDAAASADTASTEVDADAADGARTDGLAGFDATAADIVAGIGGSDNVRSVLHCITRVRFYLKDESLADDEAVADLDGVIDVVKSGGQYQVVIGPDVVDVYDAVVAQLPNAGAGDQVADVEVVERPTTLWGWVKLGFSSLIGVITGSMIPVVGMLAASGILKGLLALLVQFKVVTEVSNTFHFIDAMSSSMFFFLPIIVGFTAAKRLGADPIVVAIIGGVLCYPSVVDMSKNTDDVINAVLGFNYTLAGLLIGGFYQCLVIFGLHWAVIPIISSELANPGYSHLNAIVSATMIAQGGGALAVWVKVRDARIKRMAAPATISAFCGVTEPAMYGLNLKYGRIFITASIGGAVGGLLTGLLNVNMWGFTGGFVGFPSFVNPKGMDASFTGFWIAGVAALLVSFLCTYFFGFKQADFDKERTVKKVRLGNREPVAK